MYTPACGAQNFWRSGSCLSSSSAEPSFHRFGCFCRVLRHFGQSHPASSRGSSSCGPRFCNPGASWSSSSSFTGTAIRFSSEQDVCQPPRFTSNSPDWRYRLCPPPLLPGSCAFQVETDGPVPRTFPFICMEIASEPNVHTNGRHH